MGRCRLSERLVFAGVTVCFCTWAVIHVVYEAQSVGVKDGTEACLLFLLSLGNLSTKSSCVESLVDSHRHSCRRPGQKREKIYMRAQLSGHPVIPG